MEDKRGRDDSEDRKRKEEAQGARPKKRHSSSKSRKSKVGKLRKHFEEPSTSASAIEVIMEVVPTVGILKRRSCPMPSTSGADRAVVPFTRTHTRRLSFCAEAKRESTDDGMDEIDSLVLMMAKEGYYFPADFDWRVPRSQLLRMQISVRLKLDLRWHRFLARCVRELEDLYLLEATSDCVEMILAGLNEGLPADEDPSQWATLDELDDQLQLSLLDGSTIDYSSSLHSYQSYVTCVSTLSDSDNCDSFVTVVSEDAIATTSNDETQMLKDSEDDETIDDGCLDQSDDSCLDQSDDSCLDLSDHSCLDQSDDSCLDQSDASFIDQPDASFLDQPDASFLDQSDASFLDQPDDCCLDQTDASKEEDRSLNLGNKLKSDSDKAKPWWRRLLSFCSCCKDDTTSQATTQTTPSKQKQKSTGKKQSASSTRKLGSARTTRKPNVFRSKMC